jgi:hypothetical protein
MRVNLARYQLRAVWLKSWVIEGSLDGANWVEIDRRTDTLDFKAKNTVWFAVAKAVDCRFIRLTQTGKRHDGRDYLFVIAAEFFGTLFE